MIAEAEGAVVTTYKVGGRTVKFGPLTMRDVATLQALMMPEWRQMFDPHERRMPRWTDVLQWAANGVGALPLIAIAADKHDDLMTEDELNARLTPAEIGDIAGKVIGPALKVADESRAEGNATATETT